MRLRQYDKAEKVLKQALENEGQGECDIFWPKHHTEIIMANTFCSSGVKINATVKEVEDQAVPVQCYARTLENPQVSNLPVC